MFIHISRFWAGQQCLRMQPLTRFENEMNVIWIQAQENNSKVVSIKRKKHYISNSNILLHIYHSIKLFTLRLCQQLSLFYD